MPHINTEFSTSDGPEVAVVEVGQRPGKLLNHELYSFAAEISNVEF